MTTATLLSSLVGSDGHNFSSDEKSTAITTAQTFLGISEGDSDAKDMAAALLAQRILLNKRKSADDQSTLSELITDDIRSLMAEEEKSTSYKVVHYKKPTVDWR